MIDHIKNMWGIRARFEPQNKKSGIQHFHSSALYHSCGKDLKISALKGYKSAKNKTLVLWVIGFMIISLVFGGFSKPASAQTVSSGITARELIELFIALGIIGTDKVVQARALVENLQTAPPSFTFTRNLSFGSRGEDVRILQIILNSNPATIVASTGAGSAGRETNFFGPLTRSAVIRFQNFYRAEILTPAGLTSATGFVGPFTRAKLNTLIPRGGPEIPPPPPPTTSTLIIRTATQVASTLAPEGAARVPFTRFTVEAFGGSSAILSNVTVQRIGFASNAVFNSVVLLDENGRQLGNTRTLNANNQATISEPITIPAGSSRTFTVAGNMAANLDAYQGQSAGLSVVNLSSPSPISGILPINGTLHTVNSTLAIGTATVQVGSLATQAQTREIGTTGLAFASIRVNAGGVEDVRLRAVRFTQRGSISTQDITNLSAEIDGTRYPVTASSDGRSYIVIFGSGITINKGLSKEIILRGDIVGGSGRTIALDIERATDIELEGVTFGYGITPTALTTATASDTTAEFTTGTPFFHSALFSIQGGVLTFSRATTVPAQNIGILVPNQTLGGLHVDVRGEPVTVSRMVFNVSINRSSGSTASVEDITNANLVRANGQLVAGPVNAVGTGTTGTITFTDAVTFPEGETDYILRGQLGADFRESDTITVSFNPATEFTSIRGQTSGNVIIATPSTTITTNTVTVRSADVNISLSPTPVAQNIVAGTQNFVLANIQIDATASGEDVRLTSLPLTITHNGSVQNLTNCEAVDQNGTVLTTGSNIVNPSSSLSSGGIATMTFDNPFVIQKGTVKTVSIRCDISSAASSGQTYSIGITAAPTAVGVQSGRSITADITSSTGQTMTIAGAGALTVSADAASPSFTIVPGGTADITVGILNFRAGNESIDLNQVGLELSGTSASSSPGNITRVSLWDGSRLVGTAIFPGNERTTTTTLTEDFVIPANTDKDLTIKVSTAFIGPNLAGTEGASISVNYDGNNASSTRGIGLSSGTIITSATTADTNFAGFRMFRSVPYLARDNIDSTVLTSGERSLMRFKITADQRGDTGLYKFSLTFSTSTATVTNVNVFAFTDANYSQPVSGVSQGGQLSATNLNPNASGIVELYIQNAGGTNVPLQVPAGLTRYFEVRATVTGVTTGSAITTTLEGDSAMPALNTLMGTAVEIDADTNDDLIWSPNATTTSAITDRDWTNGYGVPGLPAQGLQQTIAR